MKNIKLDDFTKYKSLSSVKYSLDGKNACFVLHEMDVDENKYNSNLWIYDVNKNDYFQLTNFNEENSFIWLSDKEILFSALRDSKDKEKKKQGEEFTQYYKININGGEAKKEFRINKNVNSIKKIDNNNYIFTSTYNDDMKELNNLSEDEREEELKRRKEDKDYIVLDEIPFWSNGRGYTNKNRNRLYSYNSKTNEINSITNEYTDVEGYSFNKDKSKIIFIGSIYKNKMEIKNDIYVYDIERKEIEKLTLSEQFMYNYVNFISNNKLIISGSDMKNYGINENSKFYSYDLNTKEKKCITPDFEKSTWNSVGSDTRYGSSSNKEIDEEYLYFITTENESSYINRIDIDGNIEKITNKSGSVDGFTISNGKILFIGLRDMKLQEIYSIENNKETQITSFNEWVHKEKNIASLEKLSIKIDKNISIDGWIIKPVGFDKTKKYPAILDIHGGPKTVYGEVYYHEMQYWANEGYVVFFCNPRGSDGKGNEFSDIRGKYGTVDYEDIMNFTDTIIKKYDFIDIERIGVTGGSYGGFMTNWIIGHTDRFKAAASQRSISNWISKFCTTDIGYYFVDDQNGGTPWNNQEKLWWHSPIKYADKVKTPTLFIHSEEDYRCWVVEGIQMYTALKYHGVDSRMCIFKEENHELSRSGKPKHRIRRLKEITDWFDYYLK